MDITTAWQFFSSAGNLARITPPELDFQVLTDLGKGEIYEGMIIDYKVRPLFGLQVHWQTEIGRVNAPNSFTDRQLKGPYHTWEHTHTFTEVADGVLMHDIVRYRLPFGILGRIAHALLVKRKVEEIFSYRKKVLESLFPAAHT